MRTDGKWSKRYLRFCVGFNIYHYRLGWGFVLKLFPLIFVHFIRNGPMTWNVGEETAIYVSLFPGFPNPGSQIRLTFKHVWSRNYRESQVPRWD
jgi:hypothetical protein